MITSYLTLTLIYYERERERKKKIRGGVLWERTGLKKREKKKGEVK